MSYKIYSYY